DFVLLPFFALFITSTSGLNIPANATPQPISGNLSDAFIAIVESPIIQIVFLGCSMELHSKTNKSIPLVEMKVCLFIVFWFMYVSSPACLSDTNIRVFLKLIHKIKRNRYRQRLHISFLLRSSKICILVITNT